MSTVSKNALVSYSAMEMYELINDIDSYADFLPGCTASKIIEKKDHEVIGELTLLNKGGEQSFTTQNHLEVGKKITIKLLDGPFKRLQGVWQFQSLAENACKVSLDMEFEFDNKLMAFAFKPVFNKVINNLMDSFIQRAVEVYGKR